MIELTIHKYLSSTIQAWLIIYTSLVIINKEISFKKGLLFGIFYGAWPIFLRHFIYNVLSLPFGIHVFITILFQVIIYKLIIDKISWLQSTVGVLIPFILIIIGESFLLLPLMNVFNISFNDLSTPLVAYLAGFTGDMILVSAILILKVTRVFIKV